MNHYYYLLHDKVYRVSAKKKPSYSTRPMSGTWPIRVFNGTSWDDPSFPEAGWSVISEMRYIGKLPVGA